MLKVFGAARWLLGLPPASDIEAPQPVAATTFHRFREFPPEIRHAIWKAALPPPRVYEPEASVVDVTKPVHFLTSFPPPAMREACREANEACQSEGVFKFGYWGGHLRGMWFNVSKDAIYYACEAQYTRTELVEVNTIYLSADCAFRSPDIRDFLLSPRFDFCDRLIIALYPPGSWEMPVKTLKGTEPVFRRIDDMETIGFHEWDNTDFPEAQRDEMEVEDCISWFNAREVILGLFKMRQEAARLAGREHYEEDLEVEAVEVFRKPIPKALPA
ncbi:hypothetical protein CGCVW01_v001936 [Colletotrichum viniferum]|nr:hypothetical protein CGCVW01_v001936 [Colletotrichum viniferum]